MYDSNAIADPLQGLQQYMDGPECNTTTLNTFGAYSPCELSVLWYRMVYVVIKNLSISLVDDVT